LLLEHASTIKYNYKNYHNIRQNINDSTLIRINSNINIDTNL